MLNTLRLNGHNQEHLKHAAQLLIEGKLVAFPTETVYGLGANAFCSKAVRAVFSAKMRPPTNPLIVHVSSLEDAWKLWDLSRVQDKEQVAERIRVLAQAFWPGPLTIICQKSDLISETVSAGNAKVAVRVPSLAISRRLIELAGVPLVAPSANASTRPSPTAAEHVLRTLDGRIDAVVNGGNCEFGIESTVVDLSGHTPTILRAGAIPLSKLKEVMPTMAAMSTDTMLDKCSPGMMNKHYAPHLPHIYLCHGDDLTRAWLGGHSLLIRKSSADRLLAELGPRCAGESTVLPDDPIGFARDLYAAFYRAERLSDKALAIETPPAELCWESVADKLRRATSRELLD